VLDGFDDPILAYLESHEWGIDAISYYRQHLALGTPISLQQAVNEVVRKWLVVGRVDALIGLLTLYLYDWSWMPQRETTRYLVAMLACHPVVPFGLAIKRRDGKAGPHEAGVSNSLDPLRAQLAAGRWTPNVASHLVDMLGDGRWTPYYLNPIPTVKKRRGRQLGSGDPNIAVRAFLFRKNARRLAHEGQSYNQILDTLHDMLPVKIEKEVIRKAVGSIRGAPPKKGR
jgi:hypothetical protein